MPIRIKLIANGPINLAADDGDLPVLHTAGEDVALPNPAFLCRCGSSQNKPYCDGAHASADYTDENRCQNDALQDYKAPGITVHFNRSICSGAAACVRSLPTVFDSTGGDWIHPERASVEDVVAAVRQCPSGALTFTLNGKTEVKEETDVSFRMAPNGPYEVKGPVELDAPQWSLNASRTNFALCRCGKSANAPFCDYSHGEAGWSDSD